MIGFERVVTKSAADCALHHMLPRMWTDTAVNMECGGIRANTATVCIRGVEISPKIEFNPLELPDLCRFEIFLATDRAVRADIIIGQ